MKTYKMNTHYFAAKKFIEDLIDEKFDLNSNQTITLDCKLDGLKDLNFTSKELVQMYNFFKPANLKWTKRETIKLKQIIKSK